MKVEWQNNPPKKSMNWHKAIEYAESLGDGWRLPTIEELIDACDNNIEGFQAIHYWSSNTYAQDTNYACYVNFYFGVVILADKTFNYSVRCIRDIKE